MSKRRRSHVHECRRCVECDGEPHHFMLETVADDDGPNRRYPDQAHEVADDALMIWVCKHCPVWMEVLPDDDEDETDLEAAWFDAVAYGPVYRLAP